VHRRRRACSKFINLGATEQLRVICRMQPSYGSLKMGIRMHHDLESASTFGAS
jgi:hypothetical protein